MENYNTEKEIWKDVKGYEGSYQVSNLGRVRSLERVIRGRTYHSKMLAQRMDRYGYLRTTLYKRGKPRTITIHRIVAENFLSKDTEKDTVNHKDGDKLNNKTDNLEWASWTDNNQHALDTGLRCNKNNAQSIPVEQYTKSGEFIRSYPSMAEARRITGIDHSNIGRACRINGTAGGYKWKYADEVTQ